jgi:hypothetical protein
MRRRRAITLAACVIGVIVLIALLANRQSLPVTVAPLGRVVFDDGSLGFVFEITNHTSRKLEVEIWRTNNPTAPISGVYRRQISLGPKTGIAEPLIYPPPERVRWSVDVRCLRQPGKVETKLRTLGAWLRLCKKEPQWEYVERIEIEK